MKKYDGDMLAIDTLTSVTDFYAETQPTAIAIQGCEETLTYDELKCRSDEIAHQLIELGVTPNTAIGLNISPSPQMLCGLLAILKTGCYIVPIDTNYPINRLAYMVEETGIQLVLSATEITLDNVTVVDITNSQKPASPICDFNSVHPEQLAFCLYTSGSSGNPKGVFIEHQALVKHAKSLQQVYQLDRSDRLLIFALLNHVSGVEQLVLALVSGARLVLREGVIWSASEFIDVVDQFKLTFIDLPTSYCLSLVNAWSSVHSIQRLNSLKVLVIGGETGFKEVSQKVKALGLENLRLINVYGMTEVSGSAIFHEVIMKSEPEPKVIFQLDIIGKPLTKRSVLLLDENMNPIEEGEVGELLIGGTGLARGYLDQKLSQNSFISDPLSTGSSERFYRTGDLAKYNGNGILLYVGRRDRQVQIKGFRVELDEIESCLKSSPDVNDAAVVIHKGARSDLIAAFVKLKNGGVSLGLNSIWKMDRELEGKENVIQQPAERLKFKLQQNNIAKFNTEGIKLTRPGVDDGLNSKYVTRHSYRKFTDTGISFNDLSGLLSSVMQLRLENYPLPKYRYPSAFGLYPVQIYIYVKAGAIEDIQAGFYYYHPKEHVLYRAGKTNEFSSQVYKDYDRETYNQSGFAIFLVANMDAIEPMYGQSRAMQFSYLEAGYIGQLLMTETIEYNLGLCPIGFLEEFDILNKSFGLESNKILLHSFLGGKISNTQKERWMYLSQSSKSSEHLKTDLHDHLNKLLPEHMLPDALMIIDELPQLPNGKVDLDFLKTYEVNLEANVAYIGPTDELEVKLVEAWEYVLEVSPIGVQDDFVSLGGDSLAALNLVTEIEKRLGINLPVEGIFNLSTIQAMASAIGKESASFSPQIRQYDTVLDKSVYKKLLSVVVGTTLPQFKEHSLIVSNNTAGKKHPLFWCFNSLDAESIALSNKLGDQQPLYAMLSGVYVFDDMLHVEDISEHYVNEILAIQPDGPYYLGGNCNGAKIMIEVAHRLMLMGKKIDRLCLMEYFESRLYEYESKLMLLYGRESDLQAYRPFAWGAENWAAAFKVKPEVDWLPGQHGSYFSEPGIDALAEKVSAFLRN